MKIDTLNNNGVINMQENHWLEHPPVRMPYPESWQKEYDKEHGKKVEHKPVRLNMGAGRKLDFLRIVLAMHEMGFFTDVAGGEVDRQDVFNAFGDALGMDFERANANLSEGMNHWSPDKRAEVFGMLEKAYREYEKEILTNRKYR